MYFLSDVILIVFRLAKKYIFSAMNYNQVIEKNKSLEIPWDTFGQFS
jgi:hypothetical protein